jgi:hypothetical protein
VTSGGVTAVGGVLMGGLFGKAKNKPLTLEEALARTKEVRVNDLFKQFKDLIGYLNTNIIEITDMTKENQVDESFKSKDGGKGMQKKEGGFTEKFGKLILGGTTKSAVKNEDASNSSGFRRAPAHIPEEEIKVLREKEDLADMNQKLFKDKYLKFLTYND